MKKAYGTIYFLINKSMPGLIKIGYTLDAVESRMKQLYTSGVPSPFLLGASFLVSSPDKCENEIHKVLDEFRDRVQREFFKIELNQALKQSLDIILKYPIENFDNEFVNKESTDKNIIASVDNFDISLLQIILHDGFERKSPISTDYLAEGHSAHPFELELKLDNLSELGLIERIQGRNDILGSWKMSKEGIKFMFQNNYVLQDLIEDYKKNK